MSFTKETSPTCFRPFARLQNAVASGSPSAAHPSSSSRLVPIVGVHAERIEIVVSSSHDERTSRGNAGPVAHGFVFVLSLP